MISGSDHFETLVFKKRPFDSQKHIPWCISVRNWNPLPFNFCLSKQTDECQNKCRKQNKRKFTLVEVLVSYDVKVQVKNHHGLTHDLMTFDFWFLIFPRYNNFIRLFEHEVNIKGLCLYFVLLYFVWRHSWSEQQQWKTKLDTRGEFF